MNERIPSLVLNLSVLMYWNLAGMILFKVVAS